MPLESYPQNLDLTRQAVVSELSLGLERMLTKKERPGTKKDGQSAEWTCGKAIQGRKAWKS